MGRTWLILCAAALAACAGPPPDSQPHMADLDAVDVVAPRAEIIDGLAADSPDTALQDAGADLETLPDLASPDIPADADAEVATACRPAIEQCNGQDDDCDGETDEDTCDDGDPCSAGQCQGEAGCEFPALQGPCDDGDLCTVEDGCQEGICLGQPVQCDDGNLCTDDFCGDDGQCVFQASNIPCDDGNPCTVADGCEGGACAGVSVNCDCLQDENCAALEEGNLCNGTLYCNAEKWPYQCAVAPLTVVECPEPEGPDAPCLKAVCTPESAECVFEPQEDGIPCDDNDACSIGDACNAGMCAPGLPANCNDGNACTDDACGSGEGCIHEPNTLPCQDGNACTLFDHCDAGQCLGGDPADCDDGTPCTDDVCNPDIGCLHEANQADCDDGNLCTTGDHCEDGACAAGGAESCDDENVCTKDSCNPLVGCVHGPNSLPCTDGNACTVNDQCAEGKCVGGPPPDCDDGNLCTDDWCDLAAGCLHEANSESCDDANACTLADQCQGGWCVGGGPPDCQDSNPCTDDWCAPATGCVHEDNTKPCEDGSACTVGDQCAEGSCEPGSAAGCDDGNLCTDDSCEPLEGCLHAENVESCDDGNACTLADHCQGGWCVGGEPPDCQDGNPCTDDSCDPATGCVHADNAKPCDDGDACTLADLCGEGSCVPGGPANCADGNLCTDDWCDSLAGCLHEANAEPCDDGNTCTQDDHCSGGWCVGGAMLWCDDESFCTLDTCDPVGGCAHSSLECDDGNVCTDDWCNLETGCVFDTNQLECDDDDACTDGDVCFEGICEGETITCDDDYVCTVDTCDPETGCVFDEFFPCCGNSLAEPEEQCDDGNQQAWDGCTQCAISEFLVNTTWEYDQTSSRSAVAPFSDGRFAVAWTSLNESYKNGEIYGKVYGTDGQEVCPEFHVNSETTNMQQGAATAVLQDGSLLVVWESQHEEYDAYGVYLRRFDAECQALGPETGVDEWTIGDQDSADVAVLSDGRFVVVWESQYKDPPTFEYPDYSLGIGARLFNADGTPVGAEFSVNTYIDYGQVRPRVASFSSGGFIVVWDSWEQDGSDSAVVGQRFDAEGNKVGEEFIATVETFGSQEDPAVAVLNDDGFVVAWQSWANDQIRTRRFAANGTPLGDEVVASTKDMAKKRDPAFAPMPDGGFVIVWQYHESSPKYSIRQRRYGDDGSPQGPPENIDLYSNAHKDSSPSTTKLAGGGWLVAWQSHQLEGFPLDDIYAQRYDAEGNKLYH